MKKGDYNIHEAADEIGISKEKFLSLLNTFLNTNIDIYIAQLKNGIVKNDYKEITFCAHKISGAAANYQLDEITDCAYAIKKASSTSSLIDYRAQVEKMENAALTYRVACFKE